MRANVEKCCQINAAFLLVLSIGVKTNWWKILIKVFNGFLAKIHN